MRKALNQTCRKEQRGPYMGSWPSKDQGRSKIGPAASRLPLKAGSRRNTEKTGYKPRVAKRQKQSWAMLTGWTEPGKS